MLKTGSQNVNKPCTLAGQLPSNAKKHLKFHKKCEELEASEKRPKLSEHDVPMGNNK